MTRPLSPADRLRSLAGARPLSGSMFGAFAPTLGNPRAEMIGPNKTFGSSVPQCLSGFHWDAAAGQCVKNYVNPCGPGKHMANGQCVSNASTSFGGGAGVSRSMAGAPSQLEGSGRPRTEKVGYAPGGQTMSWNNGCRPGEVFSALLGKCVGSHVGHVVSGARTLGRPNTLGGAEPLGADCGSDGDCASDNCFLSICAPGGGTPSVSTILCGANQHVDGVFCVCDAGFQSINGECVVPNAQASSLCQTSGGTGDNSNCSCPAGYAWNPSNGCTNSAGQNGGILGSVTCDVGSAPDANGQCNCLPGLVWESTNVNDVRCVLPSKVVTCGINSAYDGKNCVCAAGMGWKSSTGYDCYPCPNGIAPGGDGNTCNPAKTGQAPVTPPPQVAPPVPVTPPPATPKPISNAAPASSDSGNGALIAVLAVGAAVVLGVAVTAKKKRGKKKLDRAFSLTCTRSSSCRPTTSPRKTSLNPRERTRGPAP